MGLSRNQTPTRGGNIKKLRIDEYEIDNAYTVSCKLIFSFPFLFLSTYLSITNEPHATMAILQPKRRNSYIITINRFSDTHSSQSTLSRPRLLTHLALPSFAYTAPAPLSLYG
jgi:hypothetical protein